MPLRPRGVVRPVTTPEPGPPPTSSAPAPAGPPSPALTRDGRDASRVPADWAELIDPDEWRLEVASTQPVLFIFFSLI